MRKSQTKSVASFCKTPNQTQPPNEQSSVLDINLPRCFSMHICCFLSPWTFSGGAASPATVLLARLEGLAVSRCSLLSSRPCCLVSLQQALQCSCSGSQLSLLLREILHSCLSNTARVCQSLTSWKQRREGDRLEMPRLNKTNMNILITFWQKATGTWKERVLCSSTAWFDSSVSYISINGVLEY